MSFFEDTDYSRINFSRYIKKDISQGHGPELVGGEGFTPLIFRLSSAILGVILAS
jgi:hypothetical protein